MFTNLSLTSKAYKLWELQEKCFNFAQTRYRSFVEDPDFFWMRNFGRFEFVRNWKTYAYSSNQSAVQEITSDSILTKHSIAEISQGISNDGYYQGLQLAPQALDALLQFAKSHPCYANRNPRLPFYIHQREQFEANLSKPLKLAGYMGTHETFEVFQKLKQDPVLLAIAAQYLGHEPKYHRGELAWSFPVQSTESEKRAAAQVLHCDINDYRTIKFFFYLTDVTPECGPHIYLEGTNRNRKFVHQLLGQRCASIPDKVLIETYGVDRLKTVCGPAGFGFVGDPYTFHQGTVPTKTPRLLLQMEFGINTYKTWYFSSGVTS